MPSSKRKASSTPSDSHKKRNASQLSKIKNILKYGDICTFDNTRQWFVQNIFQCCEKNILSLKKHDPRQPLLDQTIYIQVYVSNNKLCSSQFGGIHIDVPSELSHDNIKKGTTVIYRDKFKTSFICVVCDVDPCGNTLRIQPFGIRRHIMVNRKSIHLYYLPTLKIADTFHELKSGYPGHAIPLRTKIQKSTDGLQDIEWVGTVMDYDPTQNLYLVHKYGHNGEWRDVNDTANYFWYKHDEQDGRVEFDHVPPSTMGFNIPLVTISLKKRQAMQQKTYDSYRWDMLKNMYETGAHDAILDSIAEYDCCNIGNTHCVTMSPAELAILRCALELSRNKHNVHTKEHFSGANILKDYSSYDDYVNCIKNIEQQKVNMSGGSRDAMNSAIARYFSHTNPDNIEFYMRNLKNIFSEYAMPKVTCNIDSMEDETIKISIIYHGEPQSEELTTYKKNRQNALMRSMLFSILYPNILEPSRKPKPLKYMETNQLEKWYNKDAFYSRSSLPLFHYQKIMVMRMIMQESTNQSALSHCFEGTINTVRYNHWMGTTDNQPTKCTGGILSMDVGLGKTVCILALYKHSPIKTMIVCPLTLIDQWKSEIRKFLGSDDMVTEYHGKKKDQTGNIVLTTYGTVRSAYRNSIYFTTFERVVFDESHTIVNPLSATAMACGFIWAEKRWCVTATPVTKNSWTTLEGQLAILKVSPFGRGRHVNSFSSEDSNLFQKGIDKMWNTIFFSHTRKGLDKYKCVYDKHTSVEKIEYVEDQLNEVTFLLNQIKEIVSERNIDGERAFNATYSRLKQFTNYMLAATIHPCLVPLHMYGKRCIGHSTNMKTVSQITDGMGSSNYEAEIKKTLLNLEDTSCVICMEQFDRPTITRCNHIFCNSCIKQQISHRPKCPMCRNPISEESITEITFEEQDVEEEDGQITFFNNVGHKYTIDKTMYDLYNLRKNQTTWSSPKLKRLERIVNTIDGSVVIFSSMNSVLKLLKRQFPQAEIITGRSTRAQRKKSIQNFQDKTSNIFILSMKCASVGITLTSGSHLIFMEPCLDEAVVKQAIGRISRTGQERDITIHTLVTKKSFDEEMINMKKTCEDRYKNDPDVEYLPKEKKILKTDILLNLFY